MKKVYIYLFNGFSDWETAYLSPEIVNCPDYELVYFSDNGEAVRSMGGLTVMPDVAIDAVGVDDAAMLILPGGNTWLSDQNVAVDAVIEKMHSAGVPVAAICAATAYLLKFGYYATAKHTSNALGFLKWIAPDYAFEHNYVDKPAVTDGGLITASGIHPIEFAHEVLKVLRAKSDEDLEKWYQLFKNGIYSL